MTVNDNDIGDNDIKLFQDTIRQHSLYNFSEYSATSLKRRLLKIIEEYGLDINRLIRTISTDSLALEEVVKKITVNTTDLFRDPPIWQSILLKLLPRFRSHSSIRIWHPGCSTGQEVFSMMITLDQYGLLEKSLIYGSDINADVLEKAKKGTYRLRFNRDYLDNFNQVFFPGTPGFISDNYDAHDKYFTISETKDTIQMRKFLCEKPVYKKIDLVQHDNQLKEQFDIIICRNVIIYFNYELQNKVLNLFYRNMRNNGCLVLGLHESIIGPCASQFQKLDKFYTRR